MGAGRSVTGAAHRVLLIGPWRAGAGAGGCCSGGPDGLTEHVHVERDVTSEARAAVAVVRALRATVAGGVDVQLVDPRNTVFVLPTVYLDARRSGMRRRDAIVEAVRATTPWGLVVDGRVVSRSVPLTPEGAIAYLPPSLTHS